MEACIHKYKHLEGVSFAQEVQKLGHIDIGEFGTKIDRKNKRTHYILSNCVKNLMN